MRGLGVAASRAAVVGLALMCLCVIPRAMCAPDTSSSKWDDASLLEPGQEQTTRSSADGPVLFRIVHTGGDVSADIRVTNLETHLATQPVGHVYASRGNKLDVATAKVLSTRASPAILEIDVCDFEVGNWTIGVLYTLQAGLSGSVNTRRYFDIEYTAPSSFSCSTITAAVVGGIASALLFCVLVPCLVWYFCYRKPRLPRTDSNVTDMDFIAGGSTRTLPRVASGVRPQGQQGVSVRTPAAHNALTLAEQIAQMAALQQAQQGRAPAPTAPQVVYTQYPQPYASAPHGGVQMVPVAGPQAYYASQPHAQGSGGYA